MITIEDSVGCSETCISINNQPLLLCPKCFIYIPSITISTKENNVMLRIRCPKCNNSSTLPIEEYSNTTRTINSSSTKDKFCTMKLDHCATPALSYCINCHKWICQSCIKDHQTIPSLEKHLFYHAEIHNEISCTVHKDKRLKIYCKECNVPLCKKCKEEAHSNHSYIEFKEIIAEIDNTHSHINFTMIDSIMERNKANSEKYIGIIDKEIEELNQLKKEVKDAYERNEKSNRDIKDLMVLLQINYELLIQVPSFELFSNIKNNWNINKEEVVFNIPINDKNDKSEEGSDIDFKGNCRKLIEYFDKNYIIEFKPSIQLLSTIKAESDEINCMIQLKDERLVTASDDSSFKVWKVNHSSLICEKTVNAHDDEIYSLVQLRDSRVVSGSRDYTIKFWNILNWSCQYKINQHYDSVFSLIQLQDNRLVSSSGDATIKVWDVLSYYCFVSFPDHTEAVYVLIELKDGKVASGSYDKTVKIWDVYQKSCVKTLEGHSDYVTSLMQLIDGRLASGSKDKTIILWDCGNYNKVGVLSGARGIVFSMMQYDEETFVSGTHKDVLLWDVKRMELLGKYTEHEHYVKSLVKMKDRKTMTTCSSDKTIKFWNIYN